MYIPCLVVPMDFSTALVAHGFEYLDNLYLLTLSSSNSLNISLVPPVFRTFHPQYIPDFLMVVRSMGPTCRFNLGLASFFLIFNIYNRKAIKLQYI